MCTLSLVTRTDGLLLAMNRDERLSRELALAPELHQAGTVAAIFPTEIGGGTWIAANAYGLIFAVLNQNPTHTMPKANTRGGIIPQLVGSPGLNEARERVQHIDRAGLLPFLLIGISATEHRIMQWHFNGELLSDQEVAYRSQHWFSSGVSDQEAAAVRGPVCTKAWQSPDAGTGSWLRNLHRDHGARPGAFSICVHREDAATVSYSEIDVRPGQITFRYLAGSPCRPGDLVELALPRLS
jgi:hypothetical protein